MSKNTLLFFLLCSCIFGYGQTSQDSLYAIWQDTKEEDTTRLEALDNFIYYGYSSKDIDSALYFRKQFNELARTSKEYDWLTSSLIAEGYDYFQIGKYPEALKSYNEAIAITKITDDSLDRAVAMLQMGYLYHDNEDHITALSYYKRSLIIFEFYDDTFGKSAIYNELGSLYKERQDYEKSLEYYKKSLSLDASGEDYQPSQHYNIAGLYLDMKEYDKARVNFEKSLTQYESKEDQFGISSALSGLGEVSVELGDYKEAYDYFNQSLEMSNSINNALGISGTSLIMGNLYNSEGKFTLAIPLCRTSLSIATTLGDIGGQEGACLCLYKSYKGRGQSANALAFLEQSTALTDSIKSEATTSTLQQMEFTKKVVTDSLLQVKKGLEVEMAHQTEVRRKDKNRNIAIGVGIGFLILSLAFFSRWRYVQKSKVIIEKEKERSESLLLNILPAEIAEELKLKGEAKARNFDLASILFTDFKGFTERSATLSASDLINELNHCFKAFDMICEKYDVEKIKTIGDAYMAAGGLPIPNEKSIKNTLLAGLEMQEFMTHRNMEMSGADDFTFEMRLGIHTGPVVAGIVGIKKFQYDIWGDTVNTASRMESSGEVGRVNISQFTYDLMKDDPEFKFESRGKIEVKGKGEIEMWFVYKA